MKMSETTTHGITCDCGKTFETTDELETHIDTHQAQPDPYTRATRQPTDDELDDLVQWYRDTRDHDRKEVVETVSQCYHVIIEDYVTGCPGYAGRVLIQVGGAGPAYNAVYIWTDDGLKRCDQTDEIRVKGDQ